MTQRNNLENKASITAIAVTMAYTRASRKMLENNPCDQQTKVEIEREIALGEHLWQSGRQKLTTFNWGLTGVVASLPYGYQAGFFERVVVPGYDDIIYYRKSMIKEQIEAAIAQGITQIVFLGSGYDARPILTALKYPGVKIFEVDMGSTRDTKIEALSNLPNNIGFDGFEIKPLYLFNEVDSDGPPPYKDHEGELPTGGQIKFVKCNLERDDLQKDLEACGFVKKESTLFIGEGVSAYLNESSNKKVLIKVASLLVNSKSSFLYSFMSSARKDIGITEATAVQQANETYQFALAPREIINFASKSSLSVTEMFDPTTHLQTGGHTTAHVFYTTNDGYPHEIYYRLKNTGNTLTYQSIDQVPCIPFQPPKMQANYSYCNLL